MHASRGGAAQVWTNAPSRERCTGADLRFCRRGAWGSGWAPSTDRQGVGRRGCVGARRIVGPHLGSPTGYSCNRADRPDSNPADTQRLRTGRAGRPVGGRMRSRAARVCQCSCAAETAPNRRHPCRCAEQQSPVLQPTVLRRQQGDPDTPARRRGNLWRGGCGMRVVDRHGRARFRQPHDGSHAHSRVQRPARRQPAILCL